ELRNVRAFAMLSPWIDVGSVGSGTLDFIETRFNAVEIGKLSRPGLFYDFTRYRPMLSHVGGQRVVKIPNTVINYARGEGDTDYVFLRFLEPHAMGDIFASSALRVLERLGVQSYCLLGGMYDSVPHTRPLVITGSASGSGWQARLKEAGINGSGYEGPTTINILVSDGAAERGIEVMTLVAHLPHYAQLEDDYSGHYNMLKLLNDLYGIPLDLGNVKRMGEEQYGRVSRAVELDPEARELVRVMEKNYDEGMEQTGPPDVMSHLSPEIERYLREMEKRLDTEDGAS
ncbi:PAC2 family protein, partial [Chloroflexota bacterium]